MPESGSRVRVFPLLTLHVRNKGKSESAGPGIIVNSLERRRAVVHRAVYLQGKIMIRSVWTLVALVLSLLWVTLLNVLMH